jgi:rare lipoprotein A
MSGSGTRALLLLPTLAACAHHRFNPPALEAPAEMVAAAPEPAPRQDVQVGYATWYGARFAGRMTANGERFDPNQMTAAHRTLPFGTWVEVRRTDTGEFVRVRITDRGPFGHEERIIDLSRSAAQKLGMLKTGVARVEVRIVPGP